VEIAHLLRARGHELRLHDAHAAALPDGTPLAADLGEALAGADALVILTDHAAYRALRPGDPAVGGMRARLAVDTRSCLDAAAWRAAGFSVTRLGVGEASAGDLSVAQLGVGRTVGSGR